MAGIRASLRGRAFALGLLAALVMAITPARASEPCAPPRCVADRVTFLGREYGFNVLLPRDYDTSEARYPVWYLLHGLGGDELHWLRNSEVEEITRELPIIVVMPDAQWAGYTFDWHDPYETAFTTRVIPAVDARYRTIAGREHRAIAGMSGGAAGTMHVATRHPDLFAVAGGFSGNPYDWNPAGVGVWAFYAAAVALNVSCNTPAGPEDVCGSMHQRGLGNRVAPWGDPASDEIGWRNHSPSDLAGNLRGMALWLSAGTGVPCDDAEERDELTRYGPYGAALFLEPWSRNETERFAGVLSGHGIQHRTWLRECGLHSFTQWNRDLALFAAFALERFADAAPPAAFDYRNADPAFSVWGWTFETDNDRAREFLTIEDASCDGLTLVGSGLTRITTAPCFEPGAAVAAGGERVVADAEGRISFTADLGAPHQYRQYTAQQRALEAAGGYWTTRTITLEEGNA